MEPESAFYEAAMRRVYRWIVVVVCAGAGTALWFRGWRWALAFVLGACGAYLSFSWLHRAVEALGPGARPTPKRIFVLVGLRYLLLGSAGYVIVKIFGMNAIALVLGLFVPVAAVTLEILYELVDART